MRLGRRRLGQTAGAELGPDRHGRRHSEHVHIQRPGAAPGQPLASFVLPRPARSRRRTSPATGGPGDGPRRGWPSPPSPLWPSLSGPPDPSSPSSAPAPPSSLPRRSFSNSCTTCAPSPPARPSPTSKNRSSPPISPRWRAVSSSPPPPASSNSPTTSPPPPPAASSRASSKPSSPATSPPSSTAPRSTP